MPSGRILRPRNSKGKVAAEPRKNVKAIELHRLASGELPLQWAAFRSLRDEDETRMIYWGYDPAHKNPSIYIVDCNSHLSENITADFQYISPDGAASARPIPNLKNPSVVLAKLAPGETFILVCGGETGPLGSSAFYYFDMKRKQWGDIPPDPDSPPPEPRIGAAATMVASRLYLFGGKVKGTMRKSYDIGDILFEKETARVRCSWISTNKAYPADIPYVGFFGGSVLLDGGKYILLLPGGGTTRTREGEWNAAVDFPEIEQLVLYETQAEEDHCFSLIPSGGLQGLPEVSWYNSMLAPATILQNLPKFTMPGSMDPHPTSFLIMAYPTKSINGHMIYLWAVSVCPVSCTVKARKIDIEDDVKAIWRKKKVEFYAFFTTAAKLGLLGWKGDAPVEGSAYIGEIMV